MPSRSVLGKGLRVLVAAAVLWLAFRILRAHWTELADLRFPLVVSWGPLIAGSAVALAVYPLQILTWRHFVGRLARRIPVLDAAHVWLVSNLGKYIPGKIWTATGAGVFARRIDVGAGPAVGAVVILQLLSFGTAALLVAGIPSPPGGLPVPGWVLGSLGVVLAGAAFSLSRGSVAAASLVERLAPRVRIPPVPLPHSTIAVGLLANTLSWILYGVSLSLLAKGLLPDADLPVSRALSAFALAYVVGFLALFAPGGLGPRETILVALLKEDLGIDAAAVLAIGSRVLLTAIDFGLALPFLLRRLSRDPGMGTSAPRAEVAD